MVEEEHLNTGNEDKRLDSAVRELTETANYALDEAQFNKKRHIAAKMLLDRTGLKVLDIGSGWGGMGLYLGMEIDTLVGDKPGGAGPAADESPEVAVEQG